MAQKYHILRKYPPNFLAIKEKFPDSVKTGVVFAYYPHIYAPTTTNLPEALIEHENVHIDRQIDVGPDKWWETYMEDSSFRYNEELLAHRKEYEVQIRGVASKKRQSSILIQTAIRLSNPLYDHGVPIAQAMRDLLRTRL